MLEVGDGIARVYGLSERHGRRTGRVPRAGVTGLAFNLEENSVGVIILGDYLEIARATRSARTGELLSVPVGEAMIGRVVDPLGNPLDGKGPILTDASAGRSRSTGPRRGRPPAGEAAAADRHQGHRRHDPDRPRPARADHRRPQDRQDGHRHRHDHQPEGRERHLRLRGVRAEGVDGRAGRRGPASSRGDGLHDRRGRRRRPTPPRCSTSPRTPARAMAEYFMYEQGKTRCACTTTCRSRPPRTASCRCWCAARRAARPTPATCSTPTAACSRSAKLAERWVIVDGRRRRQRRSTDDWGVNNGDDRPRSAARASRARCTSGPGSAGSTPGQARPARASPATSSRRWPSSGGSLTALPIIETLEGEVSAYIPTNVISITDGQIYLQPDLFFAGRAARHGRGHLGVAAWAATPRSRR